MPRTAHGGTWLAAAVASILVLTASAACGGNGQTREPANGNAGQAAPAATSNGGPKDGPKDLERDVIKLGWFSDLTGGAAIAGVSNRDGALLAVEKLNSEGGVLGRPIELTPLDEACKPDTALAAVQRLLDDPKTFMIIGGSCSGSVLAVKDLLTQEKVPFYVESASSTEIVEPISRYVFAHNLGARDEAIFLTATTIEKLQPKKIGIFYNANDWGVTGSAEVQKKAAELGVETGEPIEVPLETTDYSPYILRLKEQNVDVVIPVLYDVPAFTKQAKQNNLEAELVFFGSLPLRSVMLPLAETGDLAGLSTSFITPHRISLDSDSPEMVDFVTRYKAAYGEFPDVAGLVGYTSVLVVAKAIEEAGELDRELFIDTLESMGPIDLNLVFPIEYGPEDHSGIQGDALLTFNDNDIPGENGLYGSADLFSPSS